MIVQQKQYKLYKEIFHVIYVLHRLQSSHRVHQREALRCVCNLHFLKAR